MISQFAQILALTCWLAKNDREQHHLATVYEMVEKLSNQRDILVAQEVMIKELSEEVKRLKRKYESLPSVLAD